MQISFRERLIQLLVGLLLVLVSAWLLWRNTIKDLVDRKFAPADVGKSLELSAEYLALKMRAEALEKKKAERLEEQRKRLEDEAQRVPAPGVQ
jgi:hypothetical protein